MAVDSERQGTTGEEDKGGGRAGKEARIEEGTGKGGGTTGIGHGEERKEEVRSSGMELIADLVEEAWTDASTGGEDEENQVGSEEENGI